jgi:exonuclease VII small subunit
MSEDTYTFDQARARLEEIAKQAKGASLEKCLDLLEEGVKLANVCTEKIDHTRWREEVDAGIAEARAEADGEGLEAEEAASSEEDVPAETDDDGSRASNETEDQDQDEDEEPDAEDASRDEADG